MMFTHTEKVSISKQATLILFLNLFCFLTNVFCKPRT
jgi:hypothetical protein